MQYVNKNHRLFLRSKAYHYLCLCLVLLVGCEEVGKPSDIFFGVTASIDLEVAVTLHNSTNTSPGFSWTANTNGIPGNVPWHYEYSLGLSYTPALSVSEFGPASIGSCSSEFKTWTNNSKAQDVAFVPSLNMPESIIEAPFDDPSNNIPIWVCVKIVRSDTNEVIAQDQDSFVIDATAPPISISVVDNLDSREKLMGGLCSDNLAQFTELFIFGDVESVEFDRQLGGLDLNTINPGQTSYEHITGMNTGSPSKAADLGNPGRWGCIPCDSATGEWRARVKLTPGDGPKNVQVQQYARSSIANGVCGGTYVPGPSDPLVIQSVPVSTSGSAPFVDTQAPVLSAPSKKSCEANIEMEGSCEYPYNVYIKDLSSSVIFTTPANPSIGTRPLVTNPFSPSETLPYIPCEEDGTYTFSADVPPNTFIDVQTQQVDSALNLGKTNTDYFYDEAVPFIEISQVVTSDGVQQNFNPAINKFSNPASYTFAVTPNSPAANIIRGTCDAGYELTLTGDPGGDVSGISAPCVGGGARGTFEMIVNVDPSASLGSRTLRLTQVDECQQGEFDFSVQISNPLPGVQIFSPTAGAQYNDLLGAVGPPPGAGLPISGTCDPGGSAVSFGGDVANVIIPASPNPVVCTGGGTWSAVLELSKRRNTFRTITATQVTSSAFIAQDSVSVEILDTINTPPVVNLVGASPIVLPIGSIYSEPGATAIDDFDGNFTTNQINISGFVNLGVTGAYTLTYRATDSHGATSVDVTRDIIVVQGVTVAGPGSPINSLSNVAVGGECDSAGSTVSISGMITNPHTATCIASASPPLGAWSSTVNFDERPLSARQVNVSQTTSGSGLATATDWTDIADDESPPTLELLGPNPLTVAQNAPYVEPGFNANDSLDGNLNSFVYISGGVDTSTLGTYNLTYTVNDSHGNGPVSETRQVDVVTGLTVSAPDDNSSQPNLDFNVIGTCSPAGGNVSITGHVAPAITAFACATGNFNVATNLKNFNALNIITIQQDAATIVRNVTHDNDPPTVGISKLIREDAFGDPIQNYFAGDSIPPDTTLEIQGSCSEDTRMVTLSGNFLGSPLDVLCGNLAAGQFATNISFPIGLGDSVQTIFADHDDAGANPAIQASLNVNLDVTLPVVTFTAPADASAHNGLNVSIQGTCTDPGTLNVILSGDIVPSPATTNCFGDNTWAVTISLAGADTIGPPDKIVNVKQIDGAGNESTLATITLTKDGVLVGPPVLTIDTPMIAGADEQPLGLGFKYGSQQLFGSCDSASSALVTIDGDVENAPFDTDCIGNLYATDVKFTNVSCKYPDGDRRVDVSQTGPGGTTVESQNWTRKYCKGNALLSTSSGYFNHDYDIGTPNTVQTTYAQYPDPLNLDYKTNSSNMDPDDPFLVHCLCTGEQLFRLGQSSASSYSGHWFYQMADISLAAYDKNQIVNPMYKGHSNFQGEYDGRNHQITDLDISRPTVNDQGFFGIVTGGAVMRNINLVSPKVEGLELVGGFAGRHYNAELHNVRVTGNVDIIARRYVGGFAGTSSPPSSDPKYAIKDQTFGGSVYTHMTGNSVAGGIVGTCQSNCTLRDNHLSGITVKTEERYTGGLVGTLNGKIYDSSFDGNVNVVGTITTSFGCIGGIAGYMINATALIKDTTFNGTVTAHNGLSEGVSDAGGIVGCMGTTGAPGGIIDNALVSSTAVIEGGRSSAGGIAGNFAAPNGQNDSSVIKNSTFNGLVKDGHDPRSSILGGIVGYAPQGGLIENVISSGTVRSTFNGSNSSNGTGGFVGRSHGNLTINKSHFTGVLEGFTQNYGGFIGLAAGGSNSVIKNSKSSGFVSNTGAPLSAGGFVGKSQQNNMLIKNSYFNGVVEGQKNIGGILGLKASTAVPSIENCYVTGTVRIIGNNDTNAGHRRGTMAGGILGSSEEGEVEIHKSFSKAIIEMAGNNYPPNQIGGIAGNLGGGGGGSLIKDSYADAILKDDVSSSLNAVSVGGLVGRATGYSRVINSYAKANNINVTQGGAGGLVGAFWHKSCPSLNVCVNHPRVFSSHSSGNLIGPGSIGGLIGGTGTGSIEDSFSTANVDSNNAAGYYFGGLVGSGGNLFAHIKRSFAEGDVVTGSTGLPGNAGSGRRVGGLLGYEGRIVPSYNTDVTEISESYASGNVKGWDGVGGLIGRSNVNTNDPNINHRKIFDSYATGSVEVTNGSGLGGLIGSSFNSEIERTYAASPSIEANNFDNVGGLVGYYGQNSTYENGVIQNSFSTSIFEPSSGGNTAGLIGYIAGGANAFIQLLDSNWDEINSGLVSCATNPGGEDVTNCNDTGGLGESLFTQGGFWYNIGQPGDSWDFTNTWEFTGPGELPTLQNANRENTFSSWCSVNNPGACGGGDPIWNDNPSYGDNFRLVCPLDWDNGDCASTWDAAQQ